ncbi:MAG: FAD-dependent oxidoreductase [Acetobacteraceae bacterium]|nr:FAD-dependent oxidoreductase [Acetobacteraceae bacterium]
MPEPGIIIAGAGHAGGAAAAALRQFGWKGAITVIGNEPIPPYQRPPLSKAWLTGDATAESLALRPERFYTQQTITLRLSTTIAAIDRAARAIRLADGQTLPYTTLILALGARARRLPLPGFDLPGVLELRTAADADRLKATIGPGRRIAIIGGGYIGLEAAASSRALGAEAVVLEREPRLLARVASPPLSEFFAAAHRAHGVIIHTDAQVTGLVGQNGTERGRVAGVQLADGTILPCHAALVGVGAIPNDEIAAAAGLRCENGVVVDEHARTEDPAIFAIGDLTNRPLALYGRRGRLESVPNALEQARQAAAAITGRPPPAAEVPWFWSDQYDIKLQIAGLPHDVARLVVRGDPSTGSFAVFHLDADRRVQCVESVNTPAEFMAGRLMILKRRPVDAAALADLSSNMKDLAA